MSAAIGITVDATAASAAVGCGSEDLAIGSAGASAGGGGRGGALTPDGRYAVFQSRASDLVPGDTNALWDVYRLDRQTGEFRRVSVPSTGEEPNGESVDAVITPDGRFVAFESDASNLVPGDTNGGRDVFVHDLLSNTTTRASVGTTGGQPGIGSEPTSPRPTRPAISADGRYVAFTSSKGGLVADDPTDSAFTDLFVRDLLTGTTTRENVTTAGAPATGGHSGAPSLSSDGRYLAFASSAPAFGGSPPHENATDVLVRDRTTGTTTLVTGLSQTASPGEGYLPELTADGQTVVFLTATHFAPEDFDGATDAYAADWATGSMEQVSRGVNARSDEALEISPDGRFVAYIQWMAAFPASHVTPFVVVTDRNDGVSRTAPPGNEGGALSSIDVTADGREVLHGRGNTVVASRVGVPRLGSVHPDRLRQGASHATLELQGWNLTGATIDLGPGIEVHSIEPANFFGGWDADISVAPNAPAGPRSATVTALGCSTTTDAVLSVDAAAGLQSLTPNAVGRSRSNAPLALTGFGFQPGATVTVAGGGVTVRDAVITDDGHATVHVDTTGSAATGPRDVTITNPDGTSATCPGCLFVDASPPALVAVLPSDRHVPEIVVVLADDHDVDEAATEISLTRNGAAVPHSRENATDAVILHVTSPSDGTYTVDVRPRDTAGNAGPLQRRNVFQGPIVTSFDAYGAFTGGATVAAGDVDGDGDDEIITAAGPGGGPHVRLFEAQPATQSARELTGFMAYDPAFTGGVRLAAADIDGDGTDEIATAAGPGGGPHVRVLHFDPNAGSFTEVTGFMAYDPRVTNGLSLAGGDVDGDGTDEVIVAPGPGAGPHVRAMSISPGSAREVAGFMAYDPRFNGGISVSAADVDGDGQAEILTGAGPGGGPHVQVFSIDPSLHVVQSFMAYDPAFHGGVTVAGGDPDGDGLDEVFTSAGGGGGPHVRVLIADAEGVDEVDGFMAYEPSFGGGVVVAAGDLDGDADDDVITAPGPGRVVTIIGRRLV